MPTIPEAPLIGVPQMSMPRPLSGGVSKRPVTLTELASCMMIPNETDVLEASLDHTMGGKAMADEPRRQLWKPRA